MPCLMSLPAGCAVMQRVPPGVRGPLPQRCAMPTPTSAPAGIHGASHQESATPSPTRAVVSDADALAAALAGVKAAQECLAPKSYAGGLHCNAAPMRARCIAGDAQ